MAPYVPAGEVFRCPADQGDRPLRPTVFASLGCSYQFNRLYRSDYSGIAEDWLFNLCMKKESWPPDPARFITMHELGSYAESAYDLFGGIRLTQWHGALNPGRTYDMVVEPTIKNAPEKFVAPVLFVDGHCKRCDFTQVIKSNPVRSLDPTTDWMWYKPLK